MGDFEELEQLQEGIREWLLRAARNGRSELRGLPASAVLPALCAAAFGRPLADAADLTGTAAVARIGVLSSVRADAFGEVLTDAMARVLAAHPSAEPSRRDLQRELSRSIKQVLAADDARGARVRSDIAMVLREIDAGGVACRAAIESGSQEVQRDVLAAVETVSTEFGEMAFLLGDLARAADEIQYSLDSQGSKLRATSGQVGRQAADVRMIREELALIEQRTRQWVPRQADGRPAGPSWTDGCPYRGLLPYGQAHAAVFFGRERLVAELAGKLAETGIVMVTGPSGSGKTSLLQAGLIPALTRGVQLPGSSCWPVVSITPAGRPLTELADALARLGGRDAAAVRQALADAPGDAHLLTREIALAAADAADAAEREATGSGAPRLVLIVDQFEEVFAVTGPERAAFSDAVCAMASRPAGPHDGPSAFVIIAVRSDYRDQCAAFPALAAAMQTGQLIVRPMTEAELRRAVTSPAAACGLQVEPDLVDAILADLRAAREAETAGELPLLSQAMTLTWQRREGDLLTSRGYQSTGGLARAVETSAEAVYQPLPEKEQAIARNAFRRLTAGGSPRPVTRSELRTGLPRSQWPLLDAVTEAFAGGSLLVLDADRVEIAHEILLQAWPRLRGWLASDQATLILYRQLAEDTARWRENRNDSSLLYRGMQLAAARQATRVWEADPGRYPALTQGEAGFLRASSRVAARGRWRRRTLACVLVAAVIAALAGAGIAVRSARATASRQNATEVSERLAAQSTAADATDPVLAALLAGAAWRIAPTAQARYSLLQSLAQPVRGILPARSGTVTALGYGADGATLAAAGSDGTVQLWDPASHRLMSMATVGAAADAVMFADGGKVLEVAGAGAVGRWNLTDHARITMRPLGAVPAGGVAAFSPDGTLLATSDQDGNIRLWNTATLQEIGVPMSSDTHPVDSLAFGPGGTMLAAGSSDGNVQLWGTATQTEAGPALTAGSAPVTALGFSAGGGILATGGQDGAARLWNTATGGQDGAAMATGGPVAVLAFSSDGATLATAGSDGPTELWDTATQAQTGPPLAAAGSGGVSSLAFSPDGGMLATGGSGTIELWDPAGFHQVSAPLMVGTPGRGPGLAAIAADGGMLAVTDDRRTVRLWDLRRRRPADAPISSDDTVTGLALNPDGTTLAVVTAGGIQLWATATGRRIGGPLTAAGAPAAAAFSPNGTVLATASADGRVRLWDVATRQQMGSPLAVGAGTTALALSPDGRTLVTADGDGTVRLWDVATRQQIGAPMTAGAQPAYAAAFSPGGQRLVTADGDGTVRLWDVTTRQQIGAPMALPVSPEPTQGAQPAYAAAFGPGGQRLVTADGDGTVRLWDVAFPPGLLQAACGIADRSLTRQQWADYAGSQPFRQVCPGS